MFRRRSEVLKWIGCGVVVIGILGWLIWQNQKAEELGWALPQGSGQSVGMASWTIGDQKGVPDGKASQGSGSKQIGYGDNSGGGRTGYVNQDERTGYSISRDGEARSAGNNENLDGREAVQIIVHTAGAVQKPGVYSLPENARVVDAVKAAGGVTGQADLNGINLASPVADGDQVMIPYQGEADSAAYTIRGGVSSSSGGGTVASVAGGSQTSSSNRSSQSKSPSTGSSSSSRKVNINTASVEELMRLPGIGESKAAAIIRYREGHGRFQRPEDLVAVGGIGEKTLERLIDLISV